MQKYDHIVVGSGISGMTLALILGMNGRRVLLIEKNRHIGGSVSRFFKKGIPFDTGFHFTGGLHKGGILDDIVTVLGIGDLLEPEFLYDRNANCFFFESDGQKFDIPYGFDNIIKRFRDYFPGETSAINRYFQKVNYVCNNTPSMNLRTLYANQKLIDEDYISLQKVLDSLTENKALKALFSGFAMCYGVKPEEISFANHSRICQGLYQSVARVKDGGDAFINAFKNKFRDCEIEVRCNSSITGLADIKERKAGRFILDSGEEISADSCTFTIHPKEILKILPDDSLSPAFVNRVRSFESSTGFFSVFSVLDESREDTDFGSSIFSIFPHYDVNSILDPLYNGNPALVLINSLENIRGRTYKTLNAFETSYFRHVEKWANSTTGNRPEEYMDYKKTRTDRIMKRVFSLFPEYRERLDILDSASVLTFRDYLNSYDGAAYGIKQKVGQINLLGKLSLHNVYAAGQSSLLPGIIGAMMSSFIVSRSLLDEDMYRKYLMRNLC